MHLQVGNVTQPVSYHKVGTYPWRLASRGKRGYSTNASHEPTLPPSCILSARCPAQSAISLYLPMLTAYRGRAVEEMVGVMLLLDLLQLVVITTIEDLLKIGLV